MIVWLHRSGISGWWNYLAISPSLLVVLLLPSDSSLHDVPWLGAT